MHRQRRGDDNTCTGDVEAAAIHEEAATVHLEVTVILAEAIETNAQATYRQ